MNTEDRLQDLLLDWQDERDRGNDVTVTELCRACPELADELERRITVLRKVDRMRDLCATAEAPPSAAPTPPRGVPGYEIEGELGRGGMGVVYKARQVSLGRPVALKMILHADHAGSDARVRFLREAETVARLRHPHIVQVHEFGSHEEQLFFSMELVEGGNLAQRQKGHPQPPAEAAALVEVLAAAIHYAHEQGVVHRDLKPANILVSGRVVSGEEPNPDTTTHHSPLTTHQLKITDFGLAKHLDSQITSTGAALGTPSYMAPEQTGGPPDRVGLPADVYALGAVLYELLTGRPPFRAATVLDTLDQVRNRDPVPPRQFVPGVPRDLETVCLKCLEKDPARRYVSARALADDLRRFQDGEPIQARPLGVLGRTWRWARRRPAQAALYAVTLLAVGVVLGLGLWFSKRLGRAEAEHHYLEQVAQTQQFFARLSQARQRAARPEPGWSWDNLADLAAAARLPEAADRQAELATEAVLCLGAIDVRPAGVVGDDLPVESVAFSPDGRWLALGQKARGNLGPCEVTLVDRRQPGAQRHLTLTPRTRWKGKFDPRPDFVRVMAFSPDGRWLAAGMASGWLHRWDLTQADPPVESWQGHTDVVDTLVFAPDGVSLYSASGQGLKRWAGAPRREAAVRPFLNYHQGLAVHPDEGWVACIADSHLHFLHADTLRPTRPPLEVSGSHMQLAADGHSLVMTEGPLVQLRDVRSGRLTGSLRPPEDGGPPPGLRDLALGEGWLALTATGADNLVRLWDLASGRLVADLPVGGGSSQVAFAADGGAFAVVDARQVQLYEVRRRHEHVLATVRPEPLAALAVAARRPALAAVTTNFRAPVGGHGYTDVLAWPAPGADSPATALTAYVSPEPSHPLAFHPDGGWLAVFNADVKGLRLVHAAGAAPGRSDIPTPRPTRLRFAADGRLWGTVGDQVRAWSVPEGRETARFSNALATLLNGNGELFGLAAGRRWVLAGGRDGGLRVLPAGTETLSAKEVVRISGVPLRAVALSDDETRAVIGTDRGEVVLTTVPEGRRLADLRRHVGRVTAVAFSPGGLLAAGGRDGVVRLYRLTDDGARELVTLTHDRSVQTLAFCDGDRSLALLLEGERAVRLWRLDHLRASLLRLGLDDTLGTLAPVASAAPPPPPRPPSTPAPGPNGLRAEVFDNVSLSHPLEVRAGVPVGWKDVNPWLPAAADGARWTGWLKAPAPGRYVLVLEGGPVARLWLDGKVLLDAWHGPQGPFRREAEVELGKGPHALRVEYAPGPPPASLALRWSRPSHFAEQPVPLTAMYHDRPE